MSYTTLTCKQSPFVMIHRDECRDILADRPFLGTQAARHQNYSAALKYAQLKLMRPMLFCPECDP